MNNVLTKTFSAIVTFCLSSVVMANEVIFRAGEEWIARDAQTQEYIIHYLGDDETPRTVRWTPATGIDVAVASQFKVQRGEIRYRYSVKNHRTSQRPVIGFKVMARAGKDDDLVSPSGWFASVVENFDDPTAGVWLDWFGRSPHRIDPNTVLNDFGFVTIDLPAVNVGWVAGAMSVLTFSDEGPSGAMLEFMERDGFMRRAAEGVPRLVAAPRIPVPAPFNAEALLTAIQDHLNKDLVTMSLIEGSFAAELNRLFTAAIEAVKHNNAKGVKENLKDIRKALKKAHGDIDDEDHDKKHADHDWEDTDLKQKPKPTTIDRLAARVLDFDVKYVLKRLGHLDD